MELFSEILVFLLQVWAPIGQAQSALKGTEVEAHFRQAAIYTGWRVYSSLRYGWAGAVSVFSGFSYEGPKTLETIDEVGRLHERC